MQLEIRMSYRVLQCATSCGLMLVLAGMAHGADSWPTFRGPQRTAVAPDKGLLTEWPEEGPKLVWKAVGAGRGYSSLAIVDGRIYTLGDAPSTADDQGRVSGLLQPGRREAAVEDEDRRSMERG